MRGLAQDISPSYGVPERYELPVIAVVAAQNFPVGKIRSTLKEGLAQTPAGTLWVVRKADRGGDKLVADILQGQPLVAVAPNPYWKYGYERGGKSRRVNDSADCRDYELAGCCSKVIVFHMEGSSRTQWFVSHARFNPRIHVITVKAPKKGKK